MSELTLFDDVRPPYHVRSMEERAKIPRNGLVAVSTFSGCGGSSLGMKTAGYTIPYAVEFTPQGAATYRANAPETFVDERDIREIQPSDILDHIGLKPGELDLFEGSPPCSSFSSAGVRAGADFGDRVGKIKLYSEGIHQRTDDLFEEWVRLIEGMRPKAILAENVPDMAKGDPVTDPTCGRAYLYRIQGMLNDLGYEVWAQVYSSLTVGAATMRKRLIIMGVRKDVGQVPRPKFTQSGYTVREALATIPVENPEDELAWSWQDGSGIDPEDGQRIPKCKKGPDCDKHPQVNGHCSFTVGPMYWTLRPGECHDKYITLCRSSWDKPMPTILASGGQAGSSAVMHPDVCRRFTATEVKWMSGFPIDFVLTGHPGRRYERIARAVTPPLYEAVGPHLERVIKGGS